MDIDAKAEQLVNADWPIDVTDSGMVIDVKAWQFANANWSIEFTEYGMDIDFKAEQYWNVYWSIDVSCEFCPLYGGNVIDVKASQ